MLAYALEYVWNVNHVLAHCAVFDLYRSLKVLNVEYACEVLECRCNYFAYSKVRQVSFACSTRFSNMI